MPVGKSARQLTLPLEPTAAIETDRLPNLLIRASAGTGKTYQLSQRYLRLLHRGIPPERILATTFTRKAAAEILDRIILKLASAATDDRKRKELGAELGIVRFSQHDCQELLQSLLRNLHRLRISTLDSLFGQIARAFSLELDLPHGWRIADDADEIEIREAAIDEVLSHDDSHAVLDLTHLLSKGEASRGVADLIRQTVVQLHDLYQEAPRDAWFAIHRSKQLDPPELEALIGELCSYPISDKRTAKARDIDCQLAAVGDWEAFISKGLGAKVLNNDLSYHSAQIPDDVVELYRRLLAQTRAVLVNRVTMQTEGSYQLLEQFDQQRRRWQEEYRAVRFEDITRALARTIGHRHEVTGSNELRSVDELGFAHRLDSSVSHLLLDEFQDTSAKQWRALTPFVRSATCREHPSSFFCVGDVKQAIYGWRGGVAEIFDAIENQITGIESSPLTHSYRSSRAVIEFVNQVFQKACEHPRLERCQGAVESWCERFQEHSTERKNWPGYATVRTAAIGDDDQKSADHVLETACRLIGELYEQAPHHEIGVLVRRNVAVSRLVHLLRKQGLPASEEGGNPLTDSTAVRLVLSLLTLVDHPGDVISRFHLAQSPLGPAFGLNDHRDQTGVQRITHELRQAVQTEGFGPVVQRAADILSQVCPRRDRDRLQQMVERAFAFPHGTTLRADDFVRRIECERVREPARSAIRVMTIHQSKGLEFDTVVLPELESRLIGQNPAVVVERHDPMGPITAVCRYANAGIQALMGDKVQRMFQAATDRQVSEALCVLYVAVTRAIHNLHIVIPSSAPNEKSFPCTLAGILRSTLYGTGLAPPNMILFSSGDPSWNGPAVEQPTAQIAPPSDSVREIRLAPLPERRRGLERVSPSSLEGGTHVRLKGWLEQDSRSAAIRGTVLHACFEQLRWLDDGPPEDSKLTPIISEVLQREGVSDATDDWLTQFRNCLAHPHIDRQLRREAYSGLAELGFPSKVVRELAKRSLTLTVETERPVAIIESGRLISGTIDRLVLLSDGSRIVAADILDFKTDAIPSGNRAAFRERVDYYRPQILAYRHAISRMTGLQPPYIAARLLFVTIGEVVVVE